MGMSRLRQKTMTPVLPILPTHDDIKKAIRDGVDLFVERKTQQALKEQKEREAELAEARANAAPIILEIPTMITARTADGHNSGTVLDQDSDYPIRSSDLDELDDVQRMVYDWCKEMGLNPVLWWGGDDAVSRGDHQEDDEFELRISWVSSPIGYQ